MAAASAGDAVAGVPCRPVRVGAGGRARGGRGRAGSEHHLTTDAGGIPLAVILTGASRWGVRADIHEAFLGLACALICRRRLTSLRQQLLIA
ncbi:hypothetical protein [Streptosporangium sp. NPDC003464]